MTYSRNMGTQNLSPAQQKFGTLSQKSKTTSKPSFGVSTITKNTNSNRESEESDSQDETDDLDEDVEDIQTEAIPVFLMNPSSDQLVKEGDILLCLGTIDELYIEEELKDLRDSINQNSHHEQTQINIENRKQRQDKEKQNSDNLVNL